MLVVRNAVVGPFAENSWVAACSSTLDAVIIDPGGDVDRILALAERGGFRVSRVVLTHAHVDHLAAAPELRRRLGVPVQLHAGDRDWLALVPQQMESFGFEGKVEVPEVDHWHTDGECLDVGEHHLRILHTPGHTRGSCSLLFEADRVVFTGDTLFAGSVGRTDLPGGDFVELQASILRKIFPLGDDVRFHPGHGPSGTIGEERRSNPFVGEDARRGRFL